MEVEKKEEEGGGGGVVVLEKIKQPSTKLPHQFGTWVAVRRPFRVDSPFFAAGNVERELLAKQISLEITEEEKKHIVQSEEEQLWQIFCPIAGCGTKLKGVGELESHYLARHSATCSVCTRVFPTTRLLNLHVSETHDSFFQAKVARNYPMYECLVEGCTARFQSDASRHQHLVDKHHFPRSFRFHVKKHPSQKQRQRHKQQQQPKPVKQQPAPPHPTCAEAPSSSEMDVDELVAGVSRLSTVEDGAVPLVSAFGHRRGRAVPFGQQTGGRRRKSRGRGGSEPPSPSPAPQ